MRWPKFLGRHLRYNRRMRENPVKIQNKIRELNTQSPAGQKNWTALIGFNALTTVDFNYAGKAIYNPSLGFPAKVFVNNTTGEIKIFSAHLFTF